MNSLVGEKLSIITPKAQTTRHRILGIVNTEDTQVIFSDTPGIIKPKYGLQKSMMSSVNESLSDADIILWVTDIHERHDEEDVISKLEKTSATYALIINKIDTSNEEEVIAKVEYWKSLLTPKAIIPISALETFNVDTVMQFIMENLPEHPAYYPKDDYFTDRSERFIASEIVREKILNTYKQEIPYSAEVVITSFKEEETIFRISAEIVVERDSQKGILIGRGGETLKKVATSARIDMEKFFGKKVFLEVFVKVIEDWRNKEKYLKQFGYES